MYLFGGVCDYRYVTDCSERNWLYHLYFVLYNNCDQGILPSGVFGLDNSWLRRKLTGHMMLWPMPSARIAYASAATVSLDFFYSSESNPVTNETKNMYTMNNVYNDNLYFIDAR